MSLKFESMTLPDNRIKVIVWEDTPQGEIYLAYIRKYPNWESELASINKPLDAHQLTQIAEFMKGLNGPDVEQNQETPLPNP